MTGKIIYLLIKIFKDEAHADAFFNQGEMYCKTLGDFKRIEGDADRGDQYEGVTGMHQPDKFVSAVLTATDSQGNVQTIELHKSDLAGPIIMQETWLEKLNLFCTYAVSAENWTESYETEEERIQAIERINSLLQTQCAINDEISRLGEYAVVVHNVPAFIGKVRSTATEANIECRSTLVKYYDPDTFHGEFTGMAAAFQKRNIYEHQNEYRFCFHIDGATGPQKLHIGSIAKMAWKMPTKDLKSTLRLQFAGLKQDSD